MKIVCIGDSLTAGVTPGDETNWVSVLSREAVHEYVGKGICGDTTGGMLARFYRDVVDDGAKSVLIMGGGNDFIVGCDTKVVQANIMAMVHQAFSHNIIPILGTPVYMEEGEIRSDWAAFTDFERVKQEYEKLRQWMFHFSKTFQTAVIDFQGEFRRKVKGQWSDYFLDGVHPNKKGNRIMADYIIRQGM